MSFTTTVIVATCFPRRERFDRSAMSPMERRPECICTGDVTP